VGGAHCAAEAQCAVCALVPPVGAASSPPRCHHRTSPQVSGCEDVTTELEIACDAIGIPECPYAGLDVTCANKEVSGTFYFSVESGYGNTCDPTSYQVSIPALTAGECFSIGIDGYGVGFEAVCS